MINIRLISLLAFTSLLLGCSSPHPVKSTEAESTGSQIKLAIVQEGTSQRAEHVFCEYGTCPQRTQKIIALPVPKSGPTIQSPKTATYSIHFRWGWSRLDEDGTKELEKAVVGLRSLQNVKMIEISGRTDPTGSLRYNQRLALRRAETVKAALVLAGYSAAAIHTRAEKPCCDGDINASKQHMQQLRRADIQIIITTTQ